VFHLLPFAISCCSVGPMGIRCFICCDFQLPCAGWVHQLNRLVLSQFFFGLDSKSASNNEKFFAFEMNFSEVLDLKCHYVHFLCFAAEIYDSFPYHRH
jgi:hypothetical protein